MNKSGVRAGQSDWKVSGIIHKLFIVSKLLAPVVRGATISGNTSVYMVNLDIENSY